MRILLLLGVVTWHVTSSNAVLVGSADSCFSNSINAFPIKFFQAVAENRSGNFACSPISASLVLSLAAFGAKGETEQQLRKALKFSSPNYLNKEKTIHFLNTAANNPPYDQLHVETGIISAKELQLNRYFRFVAESVFGSHFEEVDFIDDVQVNNILDSWFPEENTDDSKYGISGADIYFDTKLIIVNDVHFRGTWASKFDPNLTKPRIFYVNNETTKNVATMYRRGSYRIINEPLLKGRFIGIPYEDSKVSIYVFLPDEINGIDEAIKNLHLIELNQIFGEPNNMVDLLLPKFKVNCKIGLRDPLRKLGVTDMFTDKANFTGIVDAHSIMFNDIDHNVAIKVDEGCPADDSTWKAPSCSVKSPSLVDFKVDRPFLFLIGTRETIFFSAVLNDPELN